MLKAINRMLWLTRQKKPVVWKLTLSLIKMMKMQETICIMRYLNVTHGIKLKVNGRKEFKKDRTKQLEECK